MKNFFETVERFYCGDGLAVYEKAMCRTWMNGSVQTAPVTAKEQKDIALTWFDQFADRIACVKAEYITGDGHHRDILGLIANKGIWKVMGVLQSVSNFRYEGLYDDCFDQTADFRAISDVLLHYCHDVYLMDADDCLKCFWDEARMYHPNEDQTSTDVEIQILHQRWKNHPDPIANNIKEFSRIFSIDMLDANTATAKIGCAKLDDYFNDYLWLMKFNGEWKIVNKMTQCLYSGSQN